MPKKWGGSFKKMSVAAKINLVFFFIILFIKLALLSHFLNTDTATPFLDKPKKGGVGLYHTGFYVINFYKHKKISPFDPARGASGEQIVNKYPGTPNVGGTRVFLKIIFLLPLGNIDEIRTQLETTVIPRILLRDFQTLIIG